MTLLALVVLLSICDLLYHQLILVMVERNVIEVRLSEAYLLLFGPVLDLSILDVFPKVTVLCEL